MTDQTQNQEYIREFVHHITEGNLQSVLDGYKNWRIIFIERTKKHEDGDWCNGIFWDIIFERVKE